VPGSTPGTESDQRLHWTPAGLRIRHAFKLVSRRLPPKHSKGQQVLSGCSENGCLKIVVNLSGLATEVSRRNGKEKQGTAHQV